MKILLSIVVFVSFMFVGCASSEHDRYPASNGHSSLPKRAVDHDYWAACIKEREEAYCKRRMGR